MKKLILVFICLGFALPALSQTEDELKALALAQAKITSAATVANDFSTVLDYTLPSVLELMGGKDAALQGVETAMQEMKEQGIIITTSEVIKLVGFAFEQEQYRCVIETHMVVQTSPESAIESQSYIVGIYNQPAGQWHFIEGGEFKTAALIEQVLPGFKTQLVIPEDIRTNIKL